MQHRETERDWDKELAEEVRGECEDKYGPVVGIKVEKETQVRCNICPERLLRFTHPLDRARYTSSSILLNPLRKRSKVLMVVFSADEACQLLLSPTLCSRPINDRQHSPNLPFTEFALCQKKRIFLSYACCC